MLIMLSDKCKVMRLLQELNTESPKEVTLLGILISVTDLQLRKVKKGTFVI